MKDLLKTGIFKTEKGKWRCDKIYKGKRINGTFFNKNDLIDYIKESVAKIDKMVIEDRNIISKVPTLQEIFDLYKISHNWSLNTIKKRNGYFNTYFSDFKNEPVSKIDNNILLNWISYINMKIKDIAYDLHLSVSTVSKALNGAFDVSNETKQLVLDYAKKVGYKARDQRLNVE